MRTEQIAQSQPQGVGQGGWPALGAALRAELAACGRPALWSSLLALLAVFLLAPQLPLRVTIDAGYEEGVGSDLPYLQRFHSAERDSHGTYRWTTDGAQIVVPGLGRRPAAVTLRLFPVGSEILAAGPQAIAIYVGAQRIATLPLRPEGSAQTIVVPPPVDGVLRLTLRSATFSPPGDPRRLGTPLDAVELRALPAVGPTAPEWGAALAWLGAVALGWLAVRHAIEGLARAARAESARLLILGAGLVALAALLDPPRWAFGASAALTACGLAYGLAIVARAALPGLARQLGVPLDRAALGWLVLFIAVSFALRYGGRLYPGAMPGDIGFHHNRFNDTVWGLIHILSKNRGVDFPYPPIPYLIIAPLTLLGVHPRAALQLGAALADALSAAVIYAIATRVARPPVALLAAGIYVFTAATFMASWWSFDTHIYTQLCHLLLVAALAWAFPAWQSGDRRRRRRWIWAVGVLLALVYLGHFGFLINTALLAGGLVVAVWVSSWRGAAWARTTRGPLTLAVVGAGLFAGICFYSAYIALFLGQLEAASAGGLTAVAGRGPVSRAVLWETLWRAGLITHYGLFPLPLALVGTGLLWAALRRGAASDAAAAGAQRAIVWMLLGSLAVALSFAVLPFISGVSNSPRWMLFIAWVVALGAAVAVEQIWRRGWPGRLAAVVMGAVVVTNTAWIWIGPMLWRIRPPEPF